MIAGICVGGWIRKRRIKKSIHRALPSWDIYLYPNCRSMMKSLEHHRFDVILLEIRDGTELLTIRHLREQYPNMNVIVYSENGKYALDLINMGVSGYMTKPLTREKVRMQMECLRYA